MNRSHVGVLLVCATLAAGPLCAQDLAEYRAVHLGDSVQRVLEATGAAAGAVRERHHRPALLQELEWRVGSIGTIAGPAMDPVQRVQLSFYNDRLYRIFVSYDRTRIDGMTDADLVEAVSATYGEAITSASAKQLRELESTDIGQQQHDAVARWEDGEYSIVLVRGGYLEPLSLVILDKHLAADAAYAGVEATRLDVAERPDREAAKARQQAEEARLAQEKVRPANKAAFKP